MPPKTVSLHFPGGYDSSLRLATLKNWDGIVLAAPRGEIPKALQREEAQSCGVYLLLGEDQESEVAYIGETEELPVRLKSHIAKKLWWEEAFLITAASGNLNKAHIKWLESVLHDRIKAAGRARLDNQASPKKSHLSESDTGAMTEFVQILEFVLDAIGVRVLEPKSVILTPASQSLSILAGGVPRILKAIDPNIDEFLIQRPKFNVDARMVLKGRAFVVQAGSRIRSSFSEASKAVSGYARLYQDLVDKAVIMTSGANTILAQDCAFSSASAAASVVLGRPAAGTTTWVHAKSGATLDAHLSAATAPEPSPMADSLEPDAENQGQNEGTALTEPTEIAPASNAEPWPQEATHRIARRGAFAYGVFDSATQRIKVLPGARIRKDQKKGVPESMVALVAAMIASGAIVDDGEFRTLVKETDWLRPSPAGVLVVNQSVNGWDEWRDKAGVRLQALRAVQDPTISAAAAD